MSDKVQENVVYLTRNLTNLGGVLWYLIQEGVISTDEKEHIEAEGNSPAKNAKLLSTIENKDWARVGKLFLEILRKTNNGHCAHQIEGIHFKAKKDFKSSKILSGKWWPEKPILKKPFHLQNLGLELLKELHDDFLKTEHRIVSITYKSFPLGGIGKSLLAKWYGHNYEQYFNHVLWIDCGEDALLKCLQKLARDLKVEDYDKLQLVEEYARKSYDKLVECKCLCIFDNIQDYQEITKVLPKHRENFNCLMTSRKEVEKLENANIHEFKLDIVSLKFIKDKLNTKTTKFNKAVALHNNGHMEECLSILHELFTRKQKIQNDFTTAVEIIFKSLQKKMSTVTEIKFEFLDWNAQVTEMDVGFLMLYSYLRLRNNKEAFKIARQIVADAAQLMQILFVTQVPNYHLKVGRNKVQLTLGVATKKIEVSDCSFSFPSFDRLSLDSNQSVDYLELINVRLLNWSTCNWKVKQFYSISTPFVDKTNIEIKQMRIVESSLDISCLPPTIQKIHLFNMKQVFVSGGVELPNLKYLTLTLMKGCCLGDFRSAPLTHIHLYAKEVNANLLPPTLTHLQINNHDTRFVGGVRSLDKLILKGFSFEQLEECLRHFNTDNLVLHSCAIGGKELVLLMNKQIKTIAVGGVNLISEYLFLEGGKGWAIGKEYFEELNMF